MNQINYRPIGIVHSSHSDLAGMPIQPAAAGGCKGTVEIFPEFTDGLKDIEGFSRIILITHLHQSQGALLQAKPFLDKAPHGVFASRYPRRPNPIGLSPVLLLGRNGNILEIENVDLLDGTPVLDIKPYVPAFDAYPNEKPGWFAGKTDNIASARSDARFK